ncbi:MAG: hypothetical protein AB7O63_09915 [Reyranellaceae bacterium]
MSAALLPLLKAAVAAGPAGRSYSYNGYYESTSNASSRTFSGCNIGAAATGRVVVVCAQSTGVGVTDITSVTIGGNAASLAAKYTDAGNNVAIGIWYLQVDAGTTADIVVTNSGTGSRHNIHVYSLYDLDSGTPADTDAQAANSTSVSNTLTRASGGGIAIGVANANSSSTSFTWTNLGEDQDATTESTRRVSAASDDDGGSGDLTITATITVTANVYLVSAVWA